MGNGKKESVPSVVVRVVPPKLGRVTYLTSRFSTENLTRCEAEKFEWAG